MLSSSARTHIKLEIDSMIGHHVDQISYYIGSTIDWQPRCDRLLEALDEIASMVCSPPEMLSTANFIRITELIEAVQAFLTLINQDVDSDFRSTEFGGFLTQVAAWYWTENLTRGYTTLDQVWEFIAPVSPDNIQTLGNGVFEAKWAAPVPSMDIEIMLRTEGVHVYGDVFQPSNLPNGKGIRFSVLPALVLSLCSCDSGRIPWMI